jgi:hypothetical protein
MQEDPLLEANTAYAATNPASAVQEWTMLVRIVTSGSDTKVNIVNLHKAIFTLMHQSDDKFAVKTLQGTLIDSASEFPTGADYQAQFQTQETKNQFVVAHSVYSSKALDAIKRNNPALLELLRVNNIFLDLSVTGSLFEVVLGPIFGVHPDHTSKKQLHADMLKLFAVHKDWVDPLPQLHADAKNKLPFEDFFPPFQLRTRRIRREIDDVEYSAKTTVFICAAEHRPFWEHLLVAGMSDGWFTPMGRFYLLLKGDKSQDLKTAICYHNRMRESMKAIVITGISSDTMDCGVRPPHSPEERPTLREHLHKGGLITLISSHEKDKWIGITLDPEAAKTVINTSIRDLCAEIYDDGTAPVAATPSRATRHARPGSTNSRNTSRQSKASRSALLEKQASSWADIARINDDVSTIHSTSNIARRPPRDVTYRSKVCFDIEVIQLEQEAKKPDAGDTETAFTAITQDYLDDMESRICAKFQDEIGSRFSDISSPADTQSRQDQLEATISSQLDKHNSQIQLTLVTMQSMMQAMQQLVADVSRNRDCHSPSPLSNQEDSVDDDATFEDEYGGEISAGYSPHSPNRDKSQDDRQDYVSTQPTADSYIVTYDTDPFKTINKRSNPTKKGESPAAKRSHPKKKSGRNDSILVQGNGSGAGRGSGPGRGNGQPSHSEVKTNLANRYAPLATSNAPSSSGSTK